MHNIPITNKVQNRIKQWIGTMDSINNQFTFFLRTINNFRDGQTIRDLWCKGVAILLTTITPLICDPRLKFTNLLARQTYPWMNEVDERPSDPHVFGEPKSSRQWWCCVHNDTIMHGYNAWKSILEMSTVRIIF